VNPSLKPLFFSYCSSESGIFRQIPNNKCQITNTCLETQSTAGFTYLNI
jgi:hypothetical protein